MTITTATRQELDIIIGWAAAEGWNPGLHDADSFFAADPGGFLIGRLGDESVASISVVSYGAAFAFLGLYIVRSGYRQRGLGMQIWRAGMQRLGARTIGLDGVLAQQDNYKKSGFALAYRNVRYHGVSERAAAPSVAPQADLVALRDVAFAEVCRCDAEVFPAPREAFLRCWINQPESSALGLLDAQGALAAFGVIRRCVLGYKMAPLVAQTPEQARRLLAALLATVPTGSTYFIDLPEANPHSAEFGRQHKLQAMFETARMYTPPMGTLAAVAVERVFGGASFELG